MPDPFTLLGLSCPSGGTFYICQESDTQFLGCCTTNPCADGSGLCPRGDLRNASFSADKYEDITPQECSDDRALWYTCQNMNPPFLGCCATNPCATRMCPSASLFPAELSADNDTRSVFLTTASSTPSSTSTTSAPSSTTPSSATGVTTAARLSSGAIAGIVIGAVILVLALVAGAAYMFKCGWHARRKKERETYTKSIMGSSSAADTTVPSQEFAPYRGQAAPISRI